MACPGDRPTIEPATAGATLTVDLDALRENYRTLKALARDAVCAAVVKGDAYGIGLAPAARALAEAGCETFFVALLSEGIALRRLLPDATVYVLNGLPPDSAQDFDRHDLRPVLGSLEEIEEWATFCRRSSRRRAAAVHVDTGINRLGLEAEELDRLAADPAILDTFDLGLVISHLACGDVPDHPMNADQRERFQAALTKLPAAPASLANSAGTINGAPFHFDLVRPGIALYGGRAVASRTGVTKPVVHLSGRVMQVRHVGSGDSVGYGASWTAQRPSRIAVVSVGYADGYMRILGAPTGERRAMVHVGDRPAPVVGRVSMDMITVDVTDIPAAAVGRGTRVELIGHNIGVDDLAEIAGTIGYEVLTSLGSRYARVYSGA